MVSRQPVDHIQSDHDSVRQMVNSVGNVMNDLDALFRLQTEHFDLTQTSVHELSEKRRALEDVVNTLWSKLKIHFSYEEEHLPDVLGPVLTKALMVEHGEIAREFDHVRTVLGESDFKEVPQAEILEMKANLQQAIGRLCQTIEEHAKGEDVLVKLVKKATRPQA